MEQVKTCLLKTFEYCDDKLTDNQAYRIYTNLYEKLVLYDSIDTFLDNNATIKEYFIEFKSHVCAHPDYNNNHINGCYVLGDHMEKILSPRFVKETKSDDSIPVDEHIIGWFKKNHMLNYDTDKEIVQAAFLCLFAI